MNPSSNYRVCEGREIHYMEWGTGNGETALDLPVLCLRGERSDLLLRETTAQMQQRGPEAQVVEVAGCGHAPALNTPEHYALVERFFVAAG